MDGKVECGSLVADGRSWRAVGSFRIGPSPGQDCGVVYGCQVELARRFIVGTEETAQFHLNGITHAVFIIFFLGGYAE